MDGERPPKRRCDEYQLSASQQEALKLVMEGKNVLITGRAGTGKSQVIRSVLERCEHKRVGVCAMSGIAASHIQGTTLHSYLGLPTSEFDGDALTARVTDRKSFLARKRWMQTRMIIVDECSMMDARTLAAIDATGRVVRRRPDEPFGGMQVVLIGDFLQATPIPSPGSRDPLDGRLLFAWEDFGEAVPHVVHLRENFRQADDPRLQRVLQDVRCGECGADTLRALRECAERQPAADAPRPTMLFSTKIEVHRLNSTVLSGMDGPRRTFVATETAKSAALRETLDRQCQAPRELTLVDGAQVILLKNLNLKSGLVNGTLGFVLDASGSPEGPLVRFANGVEMRVRKEKFCMEANGEVLAERTQVPLALAYALSVHKSQGLTLDTACVSLKNLGFSPNMLYVALSRVRTLEGLFIRDFNQQALDACCVDDQALRFYSQDDAFGDLPSQPEAAKSVAQ